MRPVPYSGHLALWLLETATFRRLVLGAQQAAVRAKGALITGAVLVFEQKSGGDVTI
ncbi:MAG: hypothetical protein ACJA1F_003310 [Paracoccaceae bacterium]|jgi:hypothetical protein